MPKRIKSFSVAGFLIAAFFLSFFSQAKAQPASTGYVRLHIVKGGFIVGIGGGHGILNYHGHTYRLRIGGIGVGTIGVSGADLTGRALNLRSPGDIVGTYGAAGAGGAFVAGASAVRLQNDRGVILELSGVNVGFQLSAGLAGMTISMR
jgi:hypothetical protein